MSNAPPAFSPSVHPIRHTYPHLPLRLTSLSPRFPPTPTRNAPRPCPPSARLHQRREENVPGDLYVDSSCIDCDTCRWFCPSVFHASNGKAAVYHQPTNTIDIQQALLAMKACPTGSIRTTTPNPLTKHESTMFPQPALNQSTSPPTVVQNVFFNGHTAPQSFAAASWTLLTTTGAIMMDTPRFSEKLAARLQDLAAPVGGYTYLVLSHSDDVHGHDRWAERLGVKRVIHKEECTISQKTDECELQLSNEDFPYMLGEECELLHVPGHTKGSIALLHRPSKNLFTGDHLCWSQRRNGLTPSPIYCFFSWEIQQESVAKLKDVDFLHGWPGHGRPFHFENAADRERQIEESVARMSEMKSRR